jgi:cell division septum initiation protein DivIVA
VQGSIPPGFEPESSGKQTTEEIPKNLEVSTQELEASWAGYLGPKTKVQSETLLKQKQMVPPLSPVTPTDTSQTVEGKQFTEIGSPITTLTPLQSSFRTPGPEVIFASDLTPISLEEMPPSNFFFSTKRRAIVRRESQQKEGVVTKRQRMIFDGQGLEDSELAKEMVGSLGAFATTNQWSVENLAEQLKQRNLLISQLQNQIRTVEKNVRSEVNKGLEQARASDRQEIQQLKSSLDEMHKNVQASEGRAIQQGELVKQLQAKVKLTENMVIDITIFQAQAVEVCKKLEFSATKPFEQGGNYPKSFSGGERIIG